MAGCTRSDNVLTTLLELKASSLGSFRIDAVDEGKRHPLRSHQRDVRWPLWCCTAVMTVMPDCDAWGALDCPGMRCTIAILLPVSVHGVCGAVPFPSCLLVQVFSV